MILRTILTLLLIVLFSGCELPGKEKKSSTTSEQLQKSLNKAHLVDSLKRTLEIDSLAFRYSKDSLTLHVKVPQGKPLDELSSHLSRVLPLFSYTILDCYYDRSTNKIKTTATHSSSPKDTLTIDLSYSSAYYPQCGSLVFIIRGYEKLTPETRKAFLATRYPLNWVIPSWLDSTATLLSSLQNAKGALIMQIPMESRIDRLTIKSDLTLYVDDTYHTMEKKVTQSLPKEIKIDGVASYGGDFVLNSISASEALMNVVAKKNLTFYDTREVRDNIAASSAKKAGVTYEKVVNLLASSSESTLSQQIQTLALSATTKRSLVVWADASPELLDALQANKDYFLSVGIVLKSLREIDK